MCCLCTLWYLADTRAKHKLEVERIKSENERIKHEMKCELERFKIEIQHSNQELQVELQKERERENRSGKETDRPFNT